MLQPVIFLTFANDDDNHLALLDSERKQIRDHLMPFANQNHFGFFSEPSSTLDDIFKYSNFYKNQIEVFHYAGHADSTQLFLNGQNAFAEGIAEMLAQQKNLKLVFLNGCSTRAQVEGLLDKGIPAVIATSVPINDNKACEFSGQFYHALTQQHNLQQAFQMASAFIKSKDQREIGINRGIGSLRLKREETLPWGLYTKDEDAKILDWTLPSSSVYEGIIPKTANNTKTFDSTFNINEALTQSLFESLVTYSDELEYMLFQSQNKGKKIDPRKVRRAIMDCLPSPIGEQVRKLFAADPDAKKSTLDTISVDRLEQLVITYNTLLEVLAFGMIVQIWEAKIKNENISISDTSLNSLKSIFIRSEPEKHLDYLQIMMDNFEVFEENNIPYFMEELSELKETFSSDNTFQEAYEYYKKLQKEVEQKNQISATDLNEFCLQGEIHLGYIFSKLNFCAKYKLSIIKDIQLSNPKHRAPSFRHFSVQLDNITAGYLDDEVVLSEFTDDKSVLLLKSFENIGENLNLSPFLIDENALKNEKKSKLFFFNYYDKTRNNFRYRLAYDNDDELIVDNNEFAEIEEQFNEFSKLFFNCKIQNL